METDSPAISDALNRLRANLDRILIGKRKVIRSLATGLLAGGHVLIEDVPGVGKTVLARGLARSLSAGFRRIQFTPDLLPSDVVGATVYDQDQKKFSFRPGPIFTNILLADEINRATPKTQSCLLEGMAEEQVTVDGNSYKIKPPFFVIATQNPIESHGCFPLPEAQLDRFLMRFSIGYPDPKQEREMLETQTVSHPLDALQPVMTKEDLVAAQERVRNITVSPEILDYIVKLVGSTREHRLVHVGASPRGALALRRAAQASALLAGRTYVIPDDVKENSLPVLSHRIMVRHQATVEGFGPDRVVQELIQSLPVEER